MLNVKSHQCHINGADYAQLRPASSNAGYTLFELLVVLLIIGLLAGIVTPRLASMYEGVEAAYTRDEIFNRLNALSYAAFQRNEGFSLSVFPLEDEASNEGKEIGIVKKNDVPLALPSGWHLKADKPIQFFVNGACTGGKATLQSYSQTYRIEFIPPFCRLKLS